IPSRAGKLGNNESIAVGAMMMGKGAMELVFAQIALDQGLIDESLFSLLVLMAFVSTFLAPILFKHFYNKAVCKREIPALEQPPDGKTAEAGCG
ncbi:MAG: cation:proton antiporter, partial [Thermoplasmata archaeon]|nr:cation:proton antiporter [Thermoplasmata archaeon]